MRYRKPSIHSISACKPRPSAASIAALYPRIAWSLEMTPLVGGLSARSARKPPHGVREPAHTDADERALLCPGQVFLTALHGFTPCATSAPSRMWWSLNGDGQDLGFASGRLLHEVAGTLLAPTASRPRPSSFREGRYAPTLADPKKPGRSTSDNRGLARSVPALNFAL
jgi:hypothetical protein